MILNIVLLVVGCALLYYGGDLLIRGAVGIGQRLNLPPSIVGLVFVSLGTSAPELAVSLGAAVQGLGDIAAGNVVGSNMVNVTIVLGLAASIHMLPVERQLARRDLPLLSLLTLVAVFMLHDGRLERLEAFILVVLMGLTVMHAIRSSPSVSDGDKDPDGSAPAAAGSEGASADQPDDDAQVPADNASPQAVQSDDVAPPDTTGKSVLFIIAGMVLLVIGAEALIYSAEAMARALGIPDAVIALTLTSIGTGIPEITATLIASLKGEHDIALGNVVGSNLLNIGLVLGLSGLVTPIDSAGVNWVPLSAMLGSTLLLWLIAVWRGRIARGVGVALLMIYVLYSIALLQQGLV